MLRVERAVCLSGAELHGVTGWDLQVLQTDVSRELRLGRSLGATVVVKARFFIPQRALDVLDLRVVGATALATPKPGAAVKSYYLDFQPAGSPGAAWTPPRQSTAGAGLAARRDSVVTQGMEGERY